MASTRVPPIRRKLTSQVRRIFIAGLIIVVPVVITYMVLQLVFNVIDGVLQPPLEAALNRRVPGLGIVGIVLLVFLVGLVGINLQGQHLIHQVQKELSRLPIVGTVYSASEHLVESFSGSSATGFKRVVSIEYPRKGMWTIGFLTGVMRDESDKQMALIYIPTAPTPNSGWVAVVPVEDTYDTDFSVQDALKLVLSGGILAPARFTRKALTL
ncbi:MAG: DUF502 domain-containing protein [Chloroflexi bacterium]|nr:DUF502 domain-containing protein [Chloroflexota bacterium]